MQLIREAKEGSQKAYTALFNHYYRSIRRVVFLVVEDPHDADDVTMIVFMKVFDNFDKYVPTFKFSTWLLTVAKNTAIDFIRAKNLHKIDNHRLDDLKYHKGHNDNPEVLHIHKEVDHHFKNALKKIPKNHRIVFEMYEEGISYKEISDKLGISINIVSGRIRYVRTWLLELLTNKKKL